MIEYPRVKVKSVRDVTTHRCVRMKDFRVCACIFEYTCLVCKKQLEGQSKERVKFELRNGCHCSLKKNKKLLKKKTGYKSVCRLNIGTKLKNKKSLKTIGDIGENEVAGKLEENNIISFFPKIKNTRDIDLIVVNELTGKKATIQVKTTIFDHNNYISANGSCLARIQKEDIKYDFLVVYMKNYETFWIVPKKDYIKKFSHPYCYADYHTDRPKVTCNFTTNWFNIDDKKHKQYPYQDAWHLIKKALS